MTASIWDPNQNVFVPGGLELLQQLGLEYTITAFGGAPSNSNSDNRTALQSMITALDQAGGGVGYVPYNINYGYKDADLTTHPSFTGITKPIIIRDFSEGDSYSGYPNTYDGAQERRFYFTPQTTAAKSWTTALLTGATSATLTANWTLLSGPWPVTFSSGEQRMVTFTNGATTATWTTGLSGPATAEFTHINYGQHNGNYFIIRADWPPGFQVFNDADYGAPNSANRGALDNRRAHYAVGVKGRATWQVGQGTQVGPGYTDEEMSNFVIEKLAAPGDTLGNHAVLVVERKTLNASYGGGRQLPNAVHHFERGEATAAILALLEDTAATVTVRLRVSDSSANDIDISNTSGDIIITVPSVGNILRLVRATRNVLIGTDTDAPSAILNVASVTKGFLPPRMTTAQRDAIASPTPGLMIYNLTTNKLNVRGASAWEAITSV
jgi:hypothetical protein